MHSAPETEFVTRSRIACDGGGGALGHPRVWLSLPDDRGWVDCPYCDKRFVLEGHPGAAEAAGRDAA
ncbi:MAG: zinc-finger domain-containing protein [Rhodobacteraceae bacterium]|nr:zinc-finger domain-containing protein [Paracoccaceae bacterium]